MSDPATDDRADLVEERVALALAALGEVTDPADVGALIDVRSPAEGVADLRFACTLAGYPGWVWTVSTAQIAGAAPTVLEVELLPQDGALLAPPWVPWTERLAEWRRTHPKGADADDDLDDADDDLDDDDDDLGDEVADGLDDDGLDDELGDVDVLTGAEGDPDDEADEADGDGRGEDGDRDGLVDGDDPDDEDLDDEDRDEGLREP